MSEEEVDELAEMLAEMIFDSLVRKPQGSTPESLEGRTTQNSGSQTPVSKAGEGDN